MGYWHFEENAILVISQNSILENFGKPIPKKSYDRLLAGVSFFCGVLVSFLGRIGFGVRGLPWALQVVLILVGSCGWREVWKLLCFGV